MRELNKQYFCRSCNNYREAYIAFGDEVTCDECDTFICDGCDLDETDFSE